MMKMVMLVLLQLLLVEIKLEFRLKYKGVVTSTHHSDIFLLLSTRVAYSDHSSNPVCSFSMMEQVRLSCLAHGELARLFLEPAKVGPLSNNPTLVF